MRIVVDRNTCMGIGVCESFAPNVFEVDEAAETMTVVGTVSEGNLRDIEQAVASCPNTALRLEID
jgi:ferredoxin